jgi:hypothetical protein
VLSYLSLELGLQHPVNLSIRYFFLLLSFNLFFLEGSIQEIVISKGIVFPFSDGLDILLLALGYVSKDVGSEPVLTFLQGLQCLNELFLHLLLLRSQLLLQPELPLFPRGELIQLGLYLLVPSEVLFVLS